MGVLVRNVSPRTAYETYTDFVRLLPDNVLDWLPNLVSLSIAVGTFNHSYTA